MEPLTTSKRLIILVSALGLTATAGILSYQHIQRMPFGQMLKPGLPMLDLTVVLHDLDNNKLTAESRIGSPEPPPSGDSHCPALSGGDTHSATVISPWQKRPEDCPQQAVWHVKKHPIALTVHFNDGEEVLAWWDSQAQVKALRDSRFMQGLFLGWLNSLKIKAEQLKLSGLQGEFLGKLLRDAIAADADLHYDIAHDKQGWVLSYRRGSDFSEQALPALAGLLASNGYRLAKLPEPIVSVRIGLQSFVVTEYQRRIYLAQSLEALLNVIESINEDEDHADTPLSLTLRTEALVGSFLPVLTDSGTAPIELSFNLEDGQLGDLYLPEGPWQKPLHEKIFAGVLASIPHNTFAAFAGSYYLPPTMTNADWQQFADHGPQPTRSADEPAGLALIWDFEHSEPGGALGIAIANPKQPENSEAYRQYLRHSEFGDSCAGGTVFLAASKAYLLNSMKAACEKQAPSPLDWQHGSEKERYLSAQLVSFINPATALRELFLGGGAGDSQDLGNFAPHWQQDYEQAKAAMRQDGEKLFRSLPIFSYAGQAEGGDKVGLEGKTISQEDVQ
ncbi:hypothetical protein JCM14076_05910 [Methylosoma difficile]